MLSPSPFRLLENAEHWRSRAEEIRTIADGTNDLGLMGQLLRIAIEYEGMAKLAEKLKLGSRVIEDSGSGV